MTYDRQRALWALPHLIAYHGAAMAESLEFGSIDERAETLRKFKRILERESEYGKTGHWTYDKGRHDALCFIYRNELHLWAQDDSAEIAA